MCCMELVDWCCDSVVGELDRMELQKGVCSSSTLYWVEQKVSVIVVSYELGIDF